MSNEREQPEAAAGNLSPSVDQHEGSEPQPSPFPHPPWTVGVVLVLGVVSLLFGLLVRPIFLAVGSPFIIVLLLWLYVKLFARGTTS